MPDADGEAVPVAEVVPEAGAEQALKSPTRMMRAVWTRTKGLDTFKLAPIVTRGDVAGGVRNALGCTVWRAILGAWNNASVS